MNPKRNDKIIHLEKKLKKEGKKGGEGNWFAKVRNREKKFTP